MYKVEYLPEAKNDILNLPMNIMQEVTGYLLKYESDPYKYSQKLHNKKGLNLEGYRKTYVANATYRIVIKIEDNIAKVVEVVAVGQRKDNYVYEEAYRRLFKK